MVAAADAPRRLGRRPVLDGLRGIAILLVMLMHTQILANGYAGVDVFFGLSGFLITTLLLEERVRESRISLRAFYARRARRLLPALGVLMVAAVAVNATLYTLAGWPLDDKLLTTGLFVNNWAIVLDHARLGSLAPTWSLAQEEQFYLLWPVLLMLMLRLRFDRRLIGLALVLMIAALLSMQSRVLPGLTAHTIYFAPFDRAAELLFGALGAVAWHWRLVPSPLARASRVRWLRPLAAWAGRTWRAPVCWVLVGAFVWLVLDQRLLERTVYLGAAALTVPLLLNLLATPRGLLTRAIACAPLRFLGRISYGLYLYHLLVRNVLYHYAPKLPIDLSALITFAASIALATASWHLLESRLLRNRGSAPARPVVAVHRPVRLTAEVVR